MKLWPQMQHGNPLLHMPNILQSSDSHQYPINNVNINNNNLKDNYDKRFFNFNSNNNLKDFSESLLWPLLSSSVTQRIKSLCSSKSLYTSQLGGTEMTANYSHITTMGLGEVTGPPTRVHWKPDLFSAHCDLTTALCTNAFTTFRRRHHCRRCGLIFCHLHSLHSAPLDQDVNFHPQGRIVRVCENCWHQWEKWVETRSLTSSATSKTHNSDIFTENNAKLEISPGDLYSMSPNSFDSKTTTLRTPISVPENLLEPVRELDLAGQSVPNDWHWSTF